MIAVGVVGAGGRMGRAVCRAVAADPGLELVAAVDPGSPGETIEAVEVREDLDALTDAGVRVAVDFTRPEAVMPTIRWLIDHGIHAVVGTSGITDADLEELRGRTAGSPAHVFVAPNFAIGAVLMMGFAERAARFLPSAEVIELHHDAKVDAPSGTAIATARAIAGAREQTPAPVAGDHAYPGARGVDVDGVRVHSVRLPGLVAHQEVVFGAPGQTLSIRHDTTDRSAFMPGVVLAISAVGERPGLTVGLGSLVLPS